MSIEAQDKRQAQIEEKRRQLELYMHRSKSAYKVVELTTARVTAMKTRGQISTDLEARGKALQKQLSDFDFAVNRIALELATLELEVAESAISAATESDPIVIAARKRDAELLASVKAAAEAKVAADTAAAAAAAPAQPAQ